MTKVSVLGQSNVEKKELKKIELFFHCQDDDDKNTPVGDDDLLPHEWQNIVLISVNFYQNMDLILCFDDTENKNYNEKKFRSLMLGQWNDGVV